MLKVAKRHAFVIRNVINIARRRKRNDKKKKKQKTEETREYV